MGALAKPEIVVLIQTLVNLPNRTGEERTRQTLCDKDDKNFV